MYSDYFYFAKTKEETELLQEELSQVYESLYKSNQSEVETTLKNKVRWEVSQLLRRDMRGGQGADFLKTLLKSLKNRDVLNLTLALSPNEKLISDLYEWTKVNVSNDIVLDINIDKDIIGGTVISYQGKYFDYTLRRAINQGIQVPT